MYLGIEQLLMFQIIQYDIYRTIIEMTNIKKIDADDCGWSIELI